MTLETEALAVLERLRRYALPDDKREERLARMPASAVFAAGLAPLLAADERLPTAAILEVMREVEKGSDSVWEGLASQHPAIALIQFGETFLVDAASRVRANLTRQKNIAEGVISPDVRTAVRILIHHCKERLRKGCCFYRVVLNDAMVATKIQFDTVTEQHKDVGI